MSEAQEVRLKRLAMRSWRRGTREMDLLLGRFADAELAGLSPEALDGYESLIAEDDPDLYRWISGQASIPPRHAEIVARIRRCHERATIR